MRYKDEFDDDPQSADVLAGILKAIDIRERLRPRSPLFGGLILGGTLLLLAGLLWYSYPKEAAKQELKAVPIVKAEAGPMKIIPTDPGGMDIPYRESTVFDTLRAQHASETGGRIENLLPEQEQPMPRNELFAGAKTDLKTETTSAPVIEQPAEIVKPA
ncbi:MAG TPA: SPOR domain-containing protein, partial [Alphaproteobacteria bacterium]